LDDQAVQQGEKRQKAKSPPRLADQVAPSRGLFQVQFAAPVSAFDGRKNLTQRRKGAKKKVLLTAILFILPQKKRAASDFLDNQRRLSTGGI
jgi:hypothetical protein